MTEQVNVSETTSQNQNLSSAPVQQPISNEQSSEKLLRQSEVNALIGKEKHASYERGKQEALALQQQQSNNSVAQPTVNQQPQNNVQPQLTAEQERRLADQAYQRLQNDHLVSQFAFKMSEGEKKYSDFAKVVTSLKLQNVPDIVQLANSFDNTADIMYDLAQNKSKAANLRVLYQMDPHAALEEMQNLSNSIKKNEAALANQKAVKAPLGQIKPSNVGEDNGSRTVSDIRRDPRYKV